MKGLSDEQHAPPFGVAPAERLSEDRDTALAADGLEL